MATSSEAKARSKKLQNILDMTMKLSDVELKDFKPTDIDPERKEWLEKAMEEVLENDDSKMLVMVTNRFLQFKADDTLSDEQLAEVDAIFEELNYLLEAIDVAIDFNNLGGLKHAVSLLKSTYSSVQWRAADTIANSTQNNPKLQYCVLEAKGMEALLYTLRKSDVDIVRVKCLYALSSLVGGNNVGEKLFIDFKGVDIIVNLLKDTNPKVRLKSVFLLRKIITSETAKFVTNKVEVTSNLIDVLKTSHDDSHEYTADVLLTLLNMDSYSLEEYRECRGDLNVLFTSQKKELQEKDAEKYEDLINTYEKLLQLL